MEVIAGIKHRSARDAAAALQAAHAATVAIVQQGLAGKKLTPAERQGADDLLATLAELLGGAGPAHEHLVYMLEGGITAARLRRAAEVAAP
jgi:hypothetical protein